MCERFWDEMYPSIEPGDLEGRFAPFDWIEQKLSLKLKQIPLTSTSEGESYSYVDWERACHFENLAMKDPRALQEALAKINPSVTAFRAAVIATDRSFYLDLVRDLDDAIEACTHLEEMLDQKCGKNAPGFRQFKQALNAIRQLICQDLRDEEIETDVLELESPEPARDPNLSRRPEAQFAAEPMPIAGCPKQRITCYGQNRTVPRRISSNERSSGEP